MNDVTPVPGVLDGQRMNVPHSHTQGSAQGGRALCPDRANCVGLFAARTLTRLWTARPRRYSRS
jgi:hypothetical protein